MTFLFIFDIFWSYLVIFDQKNQYLRPGRGGRDGAAGTDGRPGRTGGRGGPDGSEGFNELGF